jgi:glycosyltransferase involved in cell wall biosynthesis
VRVSVVIPLYNKEPYVRRALESVAAQTFDDYEVVVVDDGSTDAGARVVEDFARESDVGARLRLVSQPNAGPGAARNRGLKEARGEFAAFLDADDEWLPDFLSEGVRLLDASKAAAVTFNYYEFPSGESREAMWRGRGLTDGVFGLRPDTTPALAVSALAFMSPCTTLARADVLRRLGGFYARDRCVYAEDAHLWLKVLLNEPVYFDLRPLARLHVEAAGLSKNLKGARPVEPFLDDASDIEESCPEHLRPLLARVLAARALKTACVLGYWGDWRAARALARRHAVEGGWRLPYYLPSVVCRTPLGAALGRAWRALT